MPARLGVAVDLENLREGTDAVLRLIRLLDPDDAVLHLVGGAWAQRELSDDTVPGAWHVQRKVTGDEPGAADNAIHRLLDSWWREERIAVVASSDGGFDATLAAFGRHGLKAFVVTTGRPARRLARFAEVRVLASPRSVEEAAEAIESAR